MTDIQYFCPCGFHIKCDTIEDAVKEYNEHSECEFHHISEIFNMDEYVKCEACRVNVSITIKDNKNMCYRCIE